MKRLLLFAFIPLVFGCASLVPLKGNYPSTPIVYTTDNSFNNVWDKLVDFFAQKGYSIKIIDRSSGLIIANATHMDATYENKKGILANKNAVVVVPRFSDVNPDSKYTLKPDVVGDWNVRIKDLGNNKTSININLVNLQQQYVSSSSVTAAKTASYKDVDGRSTGVFEKMIYDAIK